MTKVVEKYLLQVCAFALLWLPCSGNAESQQAAPDVRVMTVNIVQQDGFLQYLLADYLAEHKINIAYSSGHHSEVARAVSRGEVDFVITHSKVRAMQKLEKQRALSRGEGLFANPMVFLGPMGDPAGISGLHDPAAALKKIQAQGFCFVVNTHQRLQKLQLAWFKQAAISPACKVEAAQEAAAEAAFAGQGYTLWALHPFAKRSSLQLQPIVIPVKALLENLNGWVVTASSVEQDSRELLAYLRSEQAQAKVTEFRLTRYPAIQAWWPAQ